MAAHRAEPAATAAALDQRRADLRSQVRRLLGVTAEPGAPPVAVTREAGAPASGYRLERVTLPSEPGITLDGTIAFPSVAGPSPALLWMDAAPLPRLIANPEFQRLARTHVVFAFHPRAVLGEPDPRPSLLALGQYMPLSLRAIIVGRTLIGLRVDDALRAIDWVASLPEVDAKAITLYGTAAQGLVALHAAALDERVVEVIAESTLVSYETALRAPLHRNLSEVLVPGVLRSYDTPDLVMAILSPAARRTITLVNPANAMGQRMRDDAVRATLASAFETDRALGTHALRIVTRGFGDPVPIP